MSNPPPPLDSSPRTRGVGRPVEFESASVLDAAQVILEASGVEGLSMRSLAAASGTALAAIYRHLGDKEAVLGAVLDRAAEDLVLVTPTGTPEQRLRILAVEIYDVLCERPWVVDVLRRGGQVGAGALHLTEEILAAADELGADESTGMAAYRTLWNYTLGALITQRPAALPPDPDSDLAVKVRRGLAEEGLSRAARFLTYPLGTPRALFLEGLDMLLPGLIAALRTPAAGESHDPSSLSS